MWKCQICGLEHDQLPTCFGIEAPWRAFASEIEFDKRVELTADQCVIDESTFFIRGHIQISINDHHEPLAFSVWSSLSEESFCDMTFWWNSPDRVLQPPYFGWLSSPIPIYDDVINLPLSVHCRKPGLTPLFTVKNEESPLALDQTRGISIKRWHEIALKLLA